MWSSQFICTVGRGIWLLVYVSYKQFLSSCKWNVFEESVLLLLRKTLLSLSVCGSLWKGSLAKLAEWTYPINPGIFYSFVVLCYCIWQFCCSSDLIKNFWQASQCYKFWKYEPNLAHSTYFKWRGDLNFHLFLELTDEFACEMLTSIKLVYKYILIYVFIYTYIDTYFCIYTHTWSYDHIINACFFLRASFLCFY